MPARHFSVLTLLLALFTPSPTSPDSSFADELSFPLNAKRILFLGDSNTHAGSFVAYLEALLQSQGVTPLPKMINAGLSSETCSGLTEPDHPFPRPDVHERLDRALNKVKPDVVVACYGMNDGIYYPFSEDRFRAYREGTQKLIDKVHASGAKLILMTPPPFDPEPLRSKNVLKPLGEKEYGYKYVFEDYDDVLAKYSDWLMTQGEKVEMLIDLHTPLKQHTLEQRKSNPAYTLAPDGVHFNDEGHRIVATTILKAWKVVPVQSLDPELEKLLITKTQLLHDAWLTEIGHLRPGLPQGLPIKDAELKAAEIDQQISDHLSQK